MRFLNRVIFLDRDGTINFDKGYTHKIEDFKFLPGAIQGLKKLSQSDYKIIITTNQAGIGRKYYRKSDVEKLHRWLLSFLKKKGVRIDKIYYCLHHPDDNCRCRKPKTGMFRKAGRELKIQLDKSWVVGDDDKDILAGKKIKARTIKIGNKKSKEIKAKPHYRAANLLEAARIILSQIGPVFGQK